MADVNVDGSREYTLSVDSFNDPKVYKSPKSIQLLLTRLILLEPGTFQTHPEIGVGLISKFRYSIDDGNLVQNLCSRIRTQIDTYIPIFAGAQVNAQVSSKSIYGTITIGNYVFSFGYNTDNNAFNSEIQSLSDL